MRPLLSLTHFPSLPTTLHPSFSPLPLSVPPTLSPSEQAKADTPRKSKPKGTTHIAKLQSYNEVKDAAQELMGLVAENRGVAVGVLYEGEEFGVSAED